MQILLPQPGAATTPGPNRPTEPIMLYALDDEGVVWLYTGTAWFLLNRHPERKDG